MPLLKRVVWPEHVSRVPLVEEWVRDESGRVFPTLMPATDIPQELEAFTNLTLANLISQLSSLSHHAEELFGELITESTKILNRTVSLQGRVDKLSVKVKNLDSNVEEVSLQDIHMRKAFKSSTMFEQQVVSRDTIPAAMLEQYKVCEAPPPLHELNPYRDDGKDGLKYYTDPAYFFNLWREEMKQETERLKRDKKQKPSKPKADGRKKGKIKKAPLLTRDAHRQKVIESGEFLVDKSQYRAPTNQVNEPNYDSSAVIDGRPLRPISIELRNNQSAIDNYVAETGSGGAPHGSPRQHPYSPSHDISAPATNQQYHPAYQEQYPGFLPASYSPENSDNASETPTRNGMQRVISNRPSQPPPAPPSGSNTPTPPSSSRGDTPTRSRGVSQGRDTLPPPPPPPGLQEVNQGGQILAGILRHNGISRLSDQDLPPPPPTPEKSSNAELPPPPPVPPGPPIQNAQNGGMAPPPPPPPPPLPNGNVSAGPLPMHPTVVANGDVKKGLLSLKKTEKKPRPVETDARSDLLKAIREGIKLRNVEIQPKPKDDHEIGDVASILIRREAFAISDSDSSPESESDSEDWYATSA